MRRVARVLAGGVTDGSEKFRCVGIAERVFFQIAVNALAKLGLSNPALKHTDHGGAFLIGDAVEGVADIVLGFDFLADFASGSESIFTFRTEFGVDVFNARSPLRLPFGDQLLLHPCGECFVEPDIVPPGRCDSSPNH